MHAQSCKHSHMINEFLQQREPGSWPVVLANAALASAGPYASLHLAPDRTMPAPHRSVFYRPDALPATQPTVSKHWRQNSMQHTVYKTVLHPYACPIWPPQLVCCCGDEEERYWWIATRLAGSNSYMQNAGSATLSACVVAVTELFNQGS